jgi:thiamine pyrophosphokinase
MNRVEDLQPGVPVILADGLFPESKTVLRFLDEASSIICCDGAAIKLLKYGLKPSYIVGDMDSLPLQYQRQFESIIVNSEDQDTNDLTKAILLAVSLGYDKVMILGATGQREDHTLGNIGLLVEHGQRLQLQILSDFGLFAPIFNSSILASYPAQQVSLFKVVGEPEVTSLGLKYALSNMSLSNWWSGSLNEAVGLEFSLDFKDGSLVVYRTR